VAFGPFGWLLAFAKAKAGSKAQLIRAFMMFRSYLQKLNFKRSKESTQI
jgi:hypothetical protein